MMVQDMRNGTNFTSVEINYSAESDDLATAVEKYTVPIICTFGLIGNSVSAFVFSRRPLRENSSSLFLVARSISDNGFLATLLVIWAASFYNIQIGCVAGLCQILIFFTYFFGCLSVWLVVLVTAENYIRICRPFLVRKVCNTRNARTTVLILFALVVLVYNFPLWTMKEKCGSYQRYDNFIQIMTYIDSAITLIVPATIMTVLMSAIAITTIAACRRRRRLSSSSMSNVQNPLTKVTTMLLIVTVTFFLLNLPYHAVRFRLMILTFVEEQNLETKLSFEASLQSVSQMLYYLSLAINVVIYAMFSSKFRTVLRDFILRANSNEQSTSKRIPVYPLQIKKLSLQDLTGSTVSGKTLPIEEMLPLHRSSSTTIWYCTNNFHYFIRM